MIYHTPGFVNNKRRLNIINKVSSCHIVWRETLANSVNAHGSTKF